MSILTFLLILFLGASIIPLDNDIKTKFVFFVAICVATTFLYFQFPRVLSVQRMSLLTTVTAIGAGATLPALSLIAPVNTKYLENFTSLTFSQQAAYVVFAWALFPVVEEIYFRGLLFPVTASRMGYLRPFHSDRLHCRGRAYRYSQETQDAQEDCRPVGAFYRLWSERHRQVRDR
jgi:membrane protease YdiL (CAAX protease family)